MKSPIDSVLAASRVNMPPRFVTNPLLPKTDLYRDTVTGFATGADFKCPACRRGASSITRIDDAGVLCECGRVTP